MDGKELHRVHSKKRCLSAQSCPSHSTCSGSAAKLSIASNMRSESLGKKKEVSLEPLSPYLVQIAPELCLTLRGMLIFAAFPDEALKALMEIFRGMKNRLYGDYGRWLWVTAYRWCKERDLHPRWRWSNRLLEAYGCGEDDPLTDSSLPNDTKSATHPKGASRCSLPPSTGTSHSQEASRKITTDNLQPPCGKVSHLDAPRKPSADNREKNWQTMEKLAATNPFAALLMKSKPAAFKRDS